MGKTAPKTTVVNLDKIDPITLPELANFKETQLKVVKENPYVAIEDNKTYEEAKRARTTLVTARTTLQKQEKLITSKLNDFKKRVKDVTGELIAITEPHEIKQQEEVKRYEDIKEQERLEKERLEQERINRIKNKIEAYKGLWSNKIIELTFDKIDENIALHKEEIEKLKEFDFEEYELDFEVAVGIVKEKFTDKIEVLNAREIVRQQQEKEAKEREERELIKRSRDVVDAYYINAQALIDDATYETIGGIQKDIEEQAVLNVHESLVDEYTQKRSRIKTMLEAKISLLQKEKQQEDERLKFEKEKAEFEQKQRDALYVERRKKLEDIGYFKHFSKDVDKIIESAFKDFSDEDFSNFLETTKKEIEAIQNSEVEQDDPSIEEVPFEETKPEHFNGISGGVIPASESNVAGPLELEGESGSGYKPNEVKNEEFHPIDWDLLNDPSLTASFLIERFNQHLKPVMDEHPKQYKLKHTKKDGYSLIFTPDEQS